ncbi:MAG: hypothetical protein ABJP48_07830 [Erythrobacter sp.]
MIPAPQSANVENGEATSLGSATRAAVSCATRLAGQSQEFTLTLETVSGRQVPVTIFAPVQSGNYPLIAFSHGAFAAPDRYRAMLAPIAAAGFVVIAPMHIDSEDFGNEAAPSQAEVWRTRNLDLALALARPQAVIDELSSRELELDPERTVALGHSYGALIAHLAAGAQAIEGVGEAADRRNAAVDVAVGWSPPGPRAGLIEPEGWSSLAVPTLTITGTKDVFPGFVDDWRVHTTSYDNTPSGLGALWVGEDVDHYFGGVFGREKPVDAASQRLFNRALATSLEFMERGLNTAHRCMLDGPITGETRSSN